MRHRIKGRKLNKTSGERKALFRNLLESLFIHKKITTTEAKGKEIRKLAEKLITLSKTGDLHARRLALQTLPNSKAVGILFNEIAPKVQDRSSGYLHLIKVGNRRGDAAPQVIVELLLTQ